VLRARGHAQVRAPLGPHTIPTPHAQAVGILAEADADRIRKLDEAMSQRLRDDAAARARARVGRGAAATAAPRCSSRARPWTSATLLSGPMGAELTDAPGRGDARR